MIKKPSILFLLAMILILCPGIVLATVQFNSTANRDPFTSLLPKQKPAQQTTGPGQQEEVVVAPKLIIQGVVWGAKFPQAIIENKVVRIGDKINESEIMEIKKEGVIVSYKGKLFTLQTQGSSLGRPAEGERR